MSAIYLQKGETIDYTNGGASAISYLDIVDLTTRIAIAASNIAVGATGSVELVGIFEIPADNSKTFAVGAAVYWDATAGKATDDTTKTPAGFAVEAATTADTVKVKLCENGLNSDITSTNTATMTNKTLTAPIITSPAITYGQASHDYATAHADWTLSAAEIKANTLVATSADAAANIIAPATVGKRFTIVNTSGQALTIKKTGGTGVTIASAKTAIVEYVGSDYIRITADA